MLKRDTLLFDDIVVEVLEELKGRGRKRTAKVAKAPFDHLLKTFSGRPFDSIKTRHFYLEHVPRARAENPKRKLNHDRTYFVRYLNWCHDHGYITEKPGRIPKPDTQADIGRELSDEEIERLFLNSETNEMRLQLEIALKTGMRLREMLHLRFSWIDFVRRLVRLPKIEEKTGRGRVISFCPELMEKIEKRRKIVLGDCVFPSPHHPDIPVDSNKTAWNNLRRKANVKCRWHDLRHTCATRLLRAGITAAIASRYLGMGEKVLNKIYAHLTEEDLRPASVVVSIPILKAS